MSVSLIDIILRRMIVINYLSDSIKEDQINKIIRANKNSPTASNYQVYDYIVVINQEKLS